MPNSPEPRDNRERLALIQRLWRELRTTPVGSKKYDALMNRIRQETDAFRESLNRDDPAKS
jgi:hypothetical protein